VLVVAVLMAGSVLAAACEGGEEEATATPTATVTAIASPTESPTPTAGEAARYEVTVRFNTSVTQDDIDETGALLRAYDDDLEFVIMESWPPIGRALLATNVMDEVCMATPAISEGMLIVRTKNHVYGIGDPRRRGIMLAGGTLDPSFTVGRSGAVCGSRILRSFRTVMRLLLPR